MNHIGINITDNKLQLIGVVEKSKTHYLKSIDEESFSEKLDFLSSDYSFNLQKSVNALKQRTQLISSKVSVTLSLNLFRIFSFPLEAGLSENELHEQVKWEFSLLFPTLSFCDQIIRQKKISQSIYSYPEILVITIDQKMVKALYEFLMKNKLTLQFIDNAHFASDLLINRKSSISIYVSESANSCCCYEDGELIGFRKFNEENNSGLIDYLTYLTSQTESNFSDFYISGDVEFEKIQHELEDLIQTRFNVIDPFSRIQQLSDTFVKNDHFINSAKLFSSAAGIGFRIS